VLCFWIDIPGGVVTTLISLVVQLGASVLLEQKGIRLESGTAPQRYTRTKAAIHHWSDRAGKVR
jgi:hypothetical protein